MKIKRDRTITAIRNIGIDTGTLLITRWKSCEPNLSNYYNNLSIGKYSCACNYELRSNLSEKSERNDFVSQQYIV